MAEAVDELDGLNGGPVSDTMAELSDTGFWQWTETILRVGASVKHIDRKEEARMVKAIGERRCRNLLNGGEQWVDVLTAILQGP